MIRPMFWNKYLQMLCSRLARRIAIAINPENKYYSDLSFIESDKYVVQMTASYCLVVFRKKFSIQSTNKCTHIIPFKGKTIRIG